MVSPESLTIRPWEKLVGLTRIRMFSVLVNRWVAAITLVLPLSLKPHILLGSRKVGKRRLIILCI